MRYFILALVSLLLVSTYASFTEPAQDPQVKEEANAVADCPFAVPLISCGDTKPIACNTTNQPITIYVRADDCCLGMNSFLFIDGTGIPLYVIPDLGYICARVVLQPGEILYLDCNGTSGDGCDFEIVNNCDCT